VFHFPHYQSGHTPHSAIRVGGLKLILLYEDSSVRLYDLDADPGERVDLASRRPADAARLRTLLESRLAAAHAQLPTENPRFDPAAAPPQRRGGGRKGGTTRPDRSDS
jgi:uncharacterized sulfatase